MFSDRLQKDKLNELLKVNGFQMKHYGRCGAIYYTENGKLLEIYFELSGVPQYDYLIDYSNLEGWTILKGEPFVFEEKSEIKKRLQDWLKSKRIKSDLT